MTGNRDSDARNDLLLRLQEDAGCSYISDLHLAVYWRQVKKAALNIPAADYPATAWNSALKYITGDSSSGADAEAAKNMLIERLDQSNL